MNIKRRQSKGIVLQNEVEELKDEIIKGLERLEDSKMGKKVIKGVYKEEDIYNGQYLTEAPDLIVGYNKDYRASWQTALGGVPEEVIEDNEKKWSGTHLIDASLIPGVLFANKEVNLNKPNILNIVPAILKLFDVSEYKNMEGENLF